MNLLIVDDEYYSAEGTKKKIAQKGPLFDEIFCAYNMTQALEYLAGHSVAIMILDIEMPGGSGLELLDHIRQQGLDTICIFLTAYAKFEYISKAMRLTSIDYLLKPVEPEDMNQALEKAIRNAKSRKKSILKEEKIRKLNEGVQSAEKNVEKVKTYIETHFKEELTRESLASEVFMNPDYLSKLFKKNTGSSLMDYVTKVRIERAKELLERTVLTISEIAIETGYSNTAYFTKMFKKYTNGVTPREYRKGLGG